MGRITQSLLSHLQRRCVRVPVDVVMLGVPGFLNLLRTVLCMGLCCRMLGIPGPRAQKGPAPAQSGVGGGAATTCAEEPIGSLHGHSRHRWSHQLLTACRKGCFGSSIMAISKPLTRTRLSALTGVQSVYLKK